MEGSCKGAMVSHCTIIQCKTEVSSHPRIFASSKVEFNPDHYYSWSMTLKTSLLLQSIHSIHLMRNGQLEGGRRKTCLWDEAS